MGQMTDTPKQWRMVPVEPSGAMQADGRDALEPFVGTLKQPVDNQWHLARLVWSAMCAASPAPDLEGLRERVARVIDPAGWETWDRQSREIDRIGLVGAERDRALESDRFYADRSLAKADAILSLLFTPDPKS